MLRVLHVTATGLTLGVSLGIAFLLVPRSRRLGDAGAMRSALTSVLRVVDPLLIGLLGVLVMTGAYSVTGLKQTLGADFFEVVQRYLALKLGLAFLVVMTGTWLAMGLGHRLVRAEGWGDPPDARAIGSMTTRLQAAALLLAALLVTTIVVSLRRGG